MRRGLKGGLDPGAGRSEGVEGSSSWIWTYLYVIIGIIVVAAIGWVVFLVIEHRNVRRAADLSSADVIRNGARTVEMGDQTTNTTTHSHNTTTA